LDQTIQNLKADNDRLKTENQKLREYQAEVDRLRTILNFQQNWQDQYNLESARVIARSPGNWYENHYHRQRNPGRNFPDLPVINPDGLVGKVGSCSKSSSQIGL
jgi:rod shape-determining protein MreC